MLFEWDTAKERANRAKHGLDIRTAARVFLDPYRIEQYDDREDYGEDRWITIGTVDPALLVVVYTVSDEAGEVIRLISARRANAQEERAYHQNRT